MRHSKLLNYRGPISCPTVVKNIDSLIQVIRTCKRYITLSGRHTIWSQDRVVVEEKLMQCIKLNQGYKDAYARVKNRHVGKEIR